MTEPSTKRTGKLSPLRMLRYCAMQRGWGFTRIWCSVMGVHSDQVYLVVSIGYVMWSRGGGM